VIFGGEYFAGFFLVRDLYSDVLPVHIVLIYLINIFVYFVTLKLVDQHPSRDHCFGCNLIKTQTLNVLPTLLTRVAIMLY